MPAWSTIVAIVLFVVAIILLWLFVSGTIPLAEIISRGAAGKLQEQVCEQFGIGKVLIGCGL